MANDASKPSSGPLDLGHFSISLAVADMEAAKSFYETLGFRRIAGDGKKFLVLASGTAKIGLFHGMFEGNMITLNPPDARAIERTLQAAGYRTDKATEPGDGPAHFVIKDPDGNVLLVDQHEATPK
ncbi:MAG: VOC family protein [Nannocystaceae bacterium]|nr:VOC family protein [Nannocystaceae bacterium]